MDGARLTRFPHLSWLHFRVSSDAAHNPLVVTIQGACHTISLTARGHHDVRWIVGAKENRWTEQIGTVHFVPGDERQHTFVTTMCPRFVSEVLLVPRRHLNDCLAAEQFEPRLERRRILAPDDVVLRTCMTRLVNGDRGDEADRDGYRDAAARRLVLRLVELWGGGRPDWHDDESTFDARTIAGLADYIDAHVRIGPSVSDLALRVGLSPSHFAKKFRLSTGLSLHRFVNRRRLEAALRMLKDHRRPLASIALDLGFSSQSHFTRLFSGLTGMTPAKYRKLFKPVTA